MLKNKPKLRFRGYAARWESRSLKEILVQRTEHQKITEDAPLLAFSYAEGVIDPENKKTNKRDFLMSDKYNKIFSRTEKDDIIYNPANVIHGAIHRNKLGTGVVSPIYKIFKVEGASAKLLGERLHTDEFIREIKKYIEGSVIKLRTLAPEQFLEMCIDVPDSIEEQERIGDLFEKIDKLITIYQRKLDKLICLKKAYLSEMFPAPGEKKPKRRFSGFTGEWEQRKLEECCREFKSGTFIPANDIAESGEYPVFGGNGLRGYTSEYNHDGEFALIGRQGALCGNMNYSTGKAYFTEHAVAVQANETADTRFMYYLLDKMNLGQYSDQSAQPGLAVGKLVKMKELFPSVDEQRRIGQHFTSLDNFITLHQCKLDKLKALKRAYLSEMFV